MSKRNKTLDKMLALLFFGWLFQWFGAIWSPIFKGELFMSGGFCMLLAMMISKFIEDNEKGEKK